MYGVVLLHRDPHERLLLYLAGNLMCQTCDIATHRACLVCELWPSSSRRCSSAFPSAELLIQILEISPVIP
jgi:hypothetical protein